VGGWRRAAASGNWLLLVEGGGPSDDKPTVTFEAPPDRDRVSASFTIRVPGCRGACETLKARGAEFLTPPVDHGRGVRAFFRDPDGHLFEISEYVPQRSEPVDPSEVQALTFDVFGTVVDWRTCVAREAERIGAREGVQANWLAFADRWRAGYQPSMQRVRAGDLPWINFDELHLITLDETLEELGIAGFSPDARRELNTAWRKLDPWPDSVAGLTRLKACYMIATLSNGNVSQLVALAKHGGLPWDAVLSAEFSGHYKPDPEVYLGAASLLSLEPEQVLMVAAHPGDLQAAAGVGFRTAFVTRTLENGPERAADAPSFPNADVTARDFVDLADQLRA